MRHMALEKLFLKRKKTIDIYRGRTFRQMLAELEALLRDYTAWENYEQDYKNLVEEKAEMLSKVLMGEIVERDEFLSEEALWIERGWQLKLVIGGLLHFARKQTKEILLQFAALYNLLEMPVVILRVIIETCPDITKNIKDAISECLHTNYFFDCKLSLRESSRGTWEEHVLREYEEGIKDGNISKVTSFMQRWHAGHLDYLEGPYAVVLALVYYCDKDLFAKMVAATETPVFVCLVCEDPEYAYDLVTLWKIAENGGIWARMEVFYHLSKLLLGCRMCVDGREKIEERAFRRMITVYMGRTIVLLLDTKKAGVLRYLLDAMPGLDLRRSEIRYLLFFLGQYLGKGISQNLSGEFIEQEFNLWNPPRFDPGVMFLLYGIQRALEKDNSSLLEALNKAVLKKWLEILCKSYNCTDEVDSYNFLPFTSLDLSVFYALSKRWQTRRRSVQFLKGLCRRLQLTDGMWFKSPMAEEQRRKALYAGIRAHAKAWSMLPPDDSISEISYSLKFLQKYFMDQRNWERMPGDAGESNKMSDIFMEILKSYQN